MPAPVEGTIPHRGADDVAAELGRHKTRDIRDMLAHIVAAADESVLRTPELLPVLKQAGVVTGRKGYFSSSRGMHRHDRAIRAGPGAKSPAVDERYEQMERKGTPHAAGPSNGASTFSF